MDSADERIRELEEALRLLTLENDQLAEHAEESLLLGGIAEKIHAVDDPGIVVDIGLEQISLLKDIPVGLCCSHTGDCIAVQRAYLASSSERLTPHAVTCQPGWAASLGNDARLVDQAELRASGLHSLLEQLRFVPTAVLLTPYRFQSGEAGFFLFSDDRQEPRLDRQKVAIARAAEMIAARMDTIMLFQELHEVNRALDERVNERTQELMAVNVSLREQIEERMKAEQALRRSEERYRQLVEHATDTILIAQAGAIMFINSRGEQLLGERKQSVQGRPITAYIHPDDRQMVLDRHERRLRGETVESVYEFRIVTASGAERWVEINAALIEWEGKPATLNFLRDVTGQKQLEQRFLQAQKMESVGRLAGGVAHDFNNILSAIVGYNDLALMKLPQDSPVREYLQVVKDSSERAAQLTRQLLAFSRKQALRMEVVDLNALIGNMSKMLGRLIGEDVNFVLQLGGHAVRITADPGQIEQVLLNLVVNARDAMPEGGSLLIETDLVHLSKEAAQEYENMPAGTYARLIVKDSGAGMTREVLSHLFEPFFTTKAEGKGTGLGLATVYGIVTQHGGFVSVGSEPEKGSTFTLHFPALALEQADEEHGEAPAPLRGDETILVVDDDPSVLQIISALLRELGYQVLEAQGGAAALAAEARYAGPIHLLLTDVVMPGMDGPQLAEQFRSRRSDTKIMYMSGYTDDRLDRVGMLGAGEVLIYKPLTVEKLGTAIQSMLQG